jgi:electron transfer flavoprotein beta subunit
MVSAVVKIDKRIDRFSVAREVDGFEEIYDVAMPAAFTIHPSAAEPREPALGDIAEAFDQMPVETLAIGQLNLDPTQVGDAGSPTRVLTMQPVRKDRSCQWIEGTPVAQADALVRQLVASGLIG